MTPGQPSKPNHFETVPTPTGDGGSHHPREMSACVTTAVAVKDTKLTLRYGFCAEFPMTYDTDSRWGRS